MMARRWGWLVMVAVAVVSLGACAGTGSKSGGGGNAIALSVTEEGFEPNRITFKAGEPVTLTVTRKTERTCATELVLKEHDINQPLPYNQPVTITFTPTAAGELTYACAMDHYKGTSWFSSPSPGMAPTASLVRTSHQGECVLQDGVVPRLGSHGSPAGDHPRG